MAGAHGEHVAVELVGKGADGAAPDEFAAGGVFFGVGDEGLDVIDAGDCAQDDAAFFGEVGQGFDELAPDVGEAACEPDAAVAGD